MKKIEVFSRENINDMLAKDSVLYSIYQQMKECYIDYYSSDRFFKDIYSTRYSFLLNQFLIQCSFHVGSPRFLHVISFDDNTSRRSYDYISIIKIKYEDIEFRIGNNFFECFQEGKVVRNFVYTFDNFLGRFFNLIIDVHTKHVLKPSLVKVLSFIDENL